MACRCRCYLTACFLELIKEISNNMIEDICIYVADLLKHVDKLYMSERLRRMMWFVLLSAVDSYLLKAELSS